MLNISYKRNWRNAVSRVLLGHSCLTVLHFYFLLRWMCWRCMGKSDVISYSLLCLVYFLTVWWVYRFWVRLFGTGFLHPCVIRPSCYGYTHQFFSGTLCWQRLKKLACKWNLANQKNYFTIYVILYSKVEVASFNGYSYIHSSRNSHFLKLSIDPFWLSIANFSNFIFH